MKKLLLTVSLSILLALQLGGCAQSNDGENWPEGKDPQTVGLLVANRFIASPHNSFHPDRPPRSITYPEVCTWYGALKFAEATENTRLLHQLEQRFLPFFEEEKHLVPRPWHVDYSVFGAIPLEHYKHNRDKRFFDMGIRFADVQWEIPVDSPQVVKNEYHKFMDQGLTWQTRYWIDDMYMITLVQSKAYEATGNKKYIERAAHEMVVYLDTIQKPNGLFYHAPDAPFFWGRGNGWMAAGMSELLSSLPADNKYYPSILASFRQMMNSLKEYQRADGLWGQLMDKPESWIETSGSAMFTYAMITGVKNGWLKPEEYTPVVRKAWIALVDHINEEGDIASVCEGTNRKNDYQYYLDRQQKTGDMHGQAPVLWCAWVLLNK
ncbi:MAG: glycoside hydrolase family 88 protein [Bacteroides sp.]|nr:glycoside hydrolase family 88 protein [Bacteroides sp.]